MASATTSRSHRLPRVNTVTLDHPWRWLSAAWVDIVSIPALSFGYGALFTAVGFVLVVGLDLAGAAYLIVPLGLGFVLVGPIAAIGLYEASRQLSEGGDAVDVSSILAAGGRNPVQIALVGMFLLLAFMAWIRLAMLEFMLFFGAVPPGLDGIVHAVVTTERGFLFLAVGALTGSGLAAGVFAMAAVAVPLLLDRPDCDAVTAMLTSFAAVRRNWRPMMLWAGLIAMLTLSGLALFMIGLAVALPLVGHASWHAYRDLVERPD